MLNNNYALYGYLYGTNDNIKLSRGELGEVGIIGVGIVILINLLILFLCIYWVNYLIKRK
jgi:hypothetical protein|nr:MAG TPA: Oxaloacetate decarboxylase, gamma chain [Herelleviridae sp.]